MSRVRTSCAVIVLSLVASACGQAEGPAIGVSGNQDGSASLQAIMSAPANPLDIVVNTDRTLQRSAIIGPEGGTLTLDHPAWGRLVLAVPAYALHAPREITMRAIASVEGLPLSGGLLGGVDFRPDGLQLMPAATLTLERPAQALAADHVLVGFAYSGDGSEFHLTPVSEREGKLVLSLHHFSGRGISAGAPSEVANLQMNHPPTLLADRLAQEAAISANADLLKLQWRGHGPGKGLEWELDQARDDAATFGDVFDAFVRWEEQVRELGLERDAFFVEAMEFGLGLAALGAANATEAAYQDCLRNNNPYAAGEMFRWLRWFKPPGEQSDNIVYNMLNMLPVDRLERLFKQLDACFRFELHFDSRLEFSMGVASMLPGVGGDILGCPVGQICDLDGIILAPGTLGDKLVQHVVSNTILELDLISMPSMKLEGRSKLIFTEFNPRIYIVDSALCNYNEEEGAPASYEVVAAWLDLGSGPVDPPPVGMIINPGETSERAVFQCSGTGAPDPMPIVPGIAERWWEAFRSQHEDLWSNSFNGYVFEDWETAEPPHFAMKVLKFESEADASFGLSGLGGFKETTVLILIHAPVNVDK